jgi:hypothetical protein
MMQKFLLTIAAWLALAGTALASGATFDFTADFNRIAAGTKFTLAPQKTVFDASYITAQSNSVILGITVVAEGKTGGNCLQWHYPVGEVGANPGISGYGNLEFYMTFPATDVINVEEDILFKPGFDINNATLTGARMGKIAPRIGLSGVRTTINWDAIAPGPSRFLAYEENYQTVGGYPVGYSWGRGGPSWTLQTGVWYHLHYQRAGGPSGYTNVYVKRDSDPSEVLIFHFGPLPDSASDSWLLAFASFFGGAGSIVAAHTDSFLDIDNIHIYSGTISLKAYKSPSVEIAPGGIMVYRGSGSP